MNRGRRLIGVAVRTGVLVGMLMGVLTACTSGEDRDDATPDGAALHAADTAVASQPAASPRYVSGPLTIDAVIAPAPVVVEGRPGPIAVYLVVMNTGAAADTLDAIEMDGARATLHEQVATAAGRGAMRPITHAAVPAGDMLRLIPGGRHVMVEGLTRAIATGDSLPFTLVFRHAGRTRVAARVVRYADLDSAIASATDAHAGH